MWYRSLASREVMQTSWFVYVVRRAPAVDRDVAVARLAQRGVPARSYFRHLICRRYTGSCSASAREAFPSLSRWLSPRSRCRSPAE